METKTKVHDVRIIDLEGSEGWAGLYIDGKLEHTGFGIKSRDIAKAAAGRPITVKRGYMEQSDDDFDNGFSFPDDISELDKREDDFQVIWDED